MKPFKKYDAWISAGLIAGFILAGILNRDYTFLIGYFVVGGWQVISMLMHTFLGWYTEKKSRRVVYHWITLVSVITLPMGSFWILLFTAPLMALYYTWICFDEVQMMNLRPLDILK